LVETEPTLVDLPPELATKPDSFAIEESFGPLLADLNGDGASDVVVRLATRGSGASTDHYAAFDGRTGAELARTKALPDDNATAVTLVSRQLVVAARNGQLTSYGMSDGSEQWTTALGGRVTSFCSGKSASSVLVETDDERRLAIDRVTGRQTETKEACSKVLSRSDVRGDPRDRRDYSAPLDTESYHCGGVRVMIDWTA
jgi:outer membrane protein assembly factor BamB